MFLSAVFVFLQRPPYFFITSSRLTDVIFFQRPTRDLANVAVSRIDIKITYTIGIKIFRIEFPFND